MDLEALASDSDSDLELTPYNIENILYENKDSVLFGTDVSLSQLSFELFSIFKSGKSPIRVITNRDELKSELAKIGVLSLTPIRHDKSQIQLR